MKNIKTLLSLLVVITVTGLIGFLTFTWAVDMYSMEPVRPIQVHYTMSTVVAAGSLVCWAMCTLFTIGLMEEIFSLIGTWWDKKFIAVFVPVLCLLAADLKAEAPTIETAEERSARHRDLEKALEDYRKAGESQQGEILTELDKATKALAAFSSRLEKKVRPAVTAAKVEVEVAKKAAEKEAPKVLKKATEYKKAETEMTNAAIKAAAATVEALMKEEPK